MSVQLQLKFSLESCSSELDEARQLYREKKETCLKLEEKLGEASSELGRLKFNAQQRQQQQQPHIVTPPNSPPYHDMQHKVCVCACV